MIATIVSGASGCRYCQAHTAHGAARMAGADEAKIAAVWEFETSDLFSPAERAALALALAAGQQPNAATDEHFRELEKHFSGRAIMEIMGMISLFGFLNRWNDTVATELEDAPFDFARETFDDSVWTPGKHRGQ
jgi:AhpD family alkylhydroperoxidase